MVQLGQTGCMVCCLTCVVCCAQLGHWAALPLDAPLPNVPSAQAGPCALQHEKRPLPSRPFYFQAAPCRAKSCPASYWLYSCNASPAIHAVHSVSFATARVSSSTLRWIRPLKPSSVQVLDILSLSFISRGKPCPNQQFPGFASVDSRSGLLTII
ncbi:hypothetical protein F4802DRAFT_233298 [Xylaria palmicola]|nr:hypothetical protein F4802DRAFT_233298 [Xylaria palmicola]